MKLSMGLVPTFFPIYVPGTSHVVDIDNILTGRTQLHATHISNIQSAKATMKK